MANELDYIELGLSCANVCGALDRGVNEKRMEELSQSVNDAVNQLTVRWERMLRLVTETVLCLHLFVALSPHPSCRSKISKSLKRPQSAIFLSLTPRVMHVPSGFHSETAFGGNP